MRKDAIGLFWQDIAKVKEKKAPPPKAVPPDRFWERPDYLPGLDAALCYEAPLMSDEELYRTAFNGDRLFFDVESFPNYFLVSFRSLKTGKVYYLHADLDHSIDCGKLHWIMENCCLIGFNSMSYDWTICTLAVHGFSASALKKATNMIIMEGFRPHEVLREFGVKKIVGNHIDIIEVAPLRGSLKQYAGRGHVRWMLGLPVHPDTVLSHQQMAIIWMYNLNDLDSTYVVYAHVAEQIALRELMTERYGVDVRSKSDAQLAEAVMATRLTVANGARPTKPRIAPGTVYYYEPPTYLSFRSRLLRWTLDRVRQTQFVIDEDGKIGLPKELASLELDINGAIYRLGIGGLHSSEKKVSHYSSSTVKLRDFDVASYYPRIIINQGLYPAHLGRAFLREYTAIVDERLQLKRAGKKADAESLKIVVNGIYGKLGSMHSIFYSPHLLIQVTLTGQLSLLLLIECFEYAGIQVVSANTDGVTVKCPVDKMDTCDAIVKWWMETTNFELEETKYRSLHSRDINNYIAVKEDGTLKLKGAYANPWIDSKNMAMRLHKNPQTTICIEAACEFLLNGTPVEKTITACTDIKKFVSVRDVTGGAVKDKTYLGKTIRWYYGTEETGPIIGAKRGHKVPRSEGAVPCMVLPDEFPKDVNYDWYINEANRILKDVGALG